MKSLVTESSCVTSAVAKAWTEAGKPSEFTIKVLDFGEKNFLGLTKRSAVVTIMYEVHKQTAFKPQDRQLRPAPQQQQQGLRPQQRDQQHGREGFQQRQDQRPQQQRPQQKFQQNQQRPQESRFQESRFQDRGPQEQRPAQQPQPRPQERMDDFWTETLVADINGWLQELAGIMQLNVEHKSTVDTKTLTLTFINPVIEGAEDERLLFSGLSYTLMQFLKKKYKKKFQGYRLLLTSRQQSADRP